MDSLCYLLKFKPLSVLYTTVTCPQKRIRQKQESGKEDAEIEALEACRWLKETGFPQYAQMYEDGQFPVDIAAVEKDHDFLDKEDIQSLFRRLNTLNKCAIMKINAPTKKEAEESDDDEQCALSDKWKYQRSSRRWSRKDLHSPTSEENGRSLLKSTSSHDSLLADQNSSSETGDSPVLDSKMNHLRSLENTSHVQTSTPVDSNAHSTNLRTPKVIQRAASERLKGAKSFLKRVESLSRSKKGHKGPRTIAEISGPVITDRDEMQEKIRHLNCKDISPSTENPSIGILDNSFASNLSSNNTSRVLSPVSESEVSMVHTASKSTSDRSNCSNTSVGALGFSPEEQDSDSSFSDTFILPADYRPGQFPKELLATQLDSSRVHSNHQVNTRTRSFSTGNEIISKTQFEKNSSPVHRGSHDPKHRSCDAVNSSNRKSIYDNVPLEEDSNETQQEFDLILAELFENIKGLNQAINGEDTAIVEPPLVFRDDHNSSIKTSHEVNNTSVGFESVAPPGGDIENSVHQEEETENEVTSGTTSSPDMSDHELHTEELSHDDSAEHLECRERRDSGVGSSLTRTSSERGKYRIRWHSFQKSHRPSTGSRNLQIYNLSAGHIMLLHKLSLLKLTALLEKYSPNRSAWSWTVPRFMKRNKSPNFKDRNVFGVPFHVMIQRTGQALPQCMLYAMRFLRRTEGEAVGIFRKSGVRSRIQKLRHEIEANPESVDFEQLQAYDVADLLKQYFRELPECLLTNKLSDVFICIFLYVPVDQRLEALQAVIILLPDENRDVLQSLLLFLSDVASHAAEHQMTASNLAVCFAPSLFNMGGSRSSSGTPSPHRTRKNPGIPDARELQEQKAAHECLTLMIQECKKLFTIPAAILSKCRCWHGDPVTLEELNRTGTEEGSGYHGYIESCIQGLLKESRDKFRGWVSCQLHGECDVSYKKVGDGHPLRLWKATIEVEAPPMEVMTRVLNERHLWDEDLLQWNTVEKLDEHTEVFQYERNSMAPHPARDFILLRSWRTDLPKGACVVISTSIEHPKAQPWGGLQGLELASRYLIEPSGAGKSRLTHISRVDIRGHSPSWYKRVYGHMCVQFMEKIRDSFKKGSSGPETNV
ncbi:hypothetical protein CHS0354_006631 [Potamilus streckersoni]|uniref:StAR-related lipid transfer protein 13 n=1 Tax=Potamilus streckersoni TaxID=2493646 RepID=A0AAE0SWH4_9BIVA|nr:hypothetical protein CHS0354_006631 [Potamilus streckersoni]